MSNKYFLLLALTWVTVASLHGQTADSLVTVGYATGNSGSFTGSVKKLDESQMNNKEQATNALDAIRGRVAGMQVERNGANALSAVRLRGTSSLTGGNDPLIIVDGVMGDLSLLSSVYPTDIESFTILKDASETSQYGSRGAAGVIEVTTLRGRAGQMRVNYNGSFGLSSVYKQLKMMSAGQYRQFGSSSSKILDLGHATDFQKTIQRTGYTQQHHLAFYGGTELSNYRVSLAYVQNETVIRRMGDRTFMSNMNMTQTMFDGLLRIDVGMFGSTGKQRTIFDDQKLFYSAAAWNPTFPDHQTNGQWDGYPSASQINNPQALLDEKNHFENSHISTHAKLTFNLLPDLRLMLFGAYTYDIDQQSQYLPTSVWNKAQAYRSTAKTENLLGNAILSFDKKLGIHSIGLMGLAEVQQETHSGYFTTVTNFTTDLFGYDNLAAGALRPWGGTGSYYEQPKMTSFMGRANYTLLDRYILAATARTDGSSKFGANNKWGFFPSVSGAWVISNEPFFTRHSSPITHLKVNIGYGLSGNQAGIDSYTTMALMQPSGFAAAGNGNIVTLADLKNINPDLKWEVSKTFNIGLDAQFFNGRLLFSMNYYRTKVEDMLYPYAVSVPPFKYNVLVANLGSMRNSGLELSVGGTPLLTRDWELTINANLTFQQNRLLSLSGYHDGQWLEAPAQATIAKLNGAGFHGGNNDVVFQVIGQPLGVFNIARCNGLVSDGNGAYTYDTGDNYIAGQAMPKALLGSNISLRYKQFDVSMQANGAFGHKIFNGTSLAYMNVSSFPLYNLLSEAVKANIKDQTVSDYWLERGDYLNIDYVTVGWRVPLRQNRFVESMRLSLTMNNVATLTSYSGLTPMLNSSNVNGTLGLDDKRSYPLYHTYTFSVSLNF